MPPSPIFATPPLLTTVPLAVPPDETFNVPPLPSVLLTTAPPDATLTVVFCGMTAALKVCPLLRVRPVIAIPVALVKP